MNVEDLKARVRTKNLSMGNDPDIPLRDFRGRFNPLGWTAHMVAARSPGGKDRIFAKIDLDEVEVLSSVAPYDYPTTTLDLPTSDREQSQWGYLMRSLIPFLAEGEPDELAGHTVRWEWRKDFYGVHPGNPDRGLGWWPCMSWNGKRGDLADDEVRAFWIVTEVNGITAEQAATIPGSVLAGEGMKVPGTGSTPEVDVDALIAETMAGKTHQDAVQDVMQLDVVRLEPAQVGRVMATDGSEGIIAEFLASGRLVEDSEGKLQLPG